MEALHRVLVLSDARHATICGVVLSSAERGLVLMGMKAANRINSDQRSGWIARFVVFRGAGVCEWMVVVVE